MKSIFFLQISDEDFLHSWFRVLTDCQKSEEWQTFSYNAMKLHCVLKIEINYEIIRNMRDILIPN